MAWCWSGDKPLSKQMMVYLTNAHDVCVTRPQWVKAATILSLKTHHLLQYHSPFDIGNAFKNAHHYSHGSDQIATCQGFRACGRSCHECDVCTGASSVYTHVLWKCIHIYPSHYRHYSAIIYACRCSGYAYVIYTNRQMCYINSFHDKHAISKLIWLPHSRGMSPNSLMNFIWIW